jgi:hypothetical protein
MKVITIGKITSGVGIGEIAKKGEHLMLDDLVRIPLRYPHICTTQKCLVRKYPSQTSNN